MDNKKKKQHILTDRTHARLLRRRVTLALAISIATFCLPVHAEWQFAPRVIVAQGYSDNFSLQPAGFEQSDYVTELSPGIQFLGTGLRWDFNLDYQYQGYFFRDFSEFDQSFHDASLASSGELIRDLFFVNLDGGYTQTLITPQATIPDSNLQVINNRTDVGFGYVEPYFQRDLGRNVIARVGYRYGRVEYPGADVGGFIIEGTVSNEVSAIVGLDDDSRMRYWEFGYYFVDVEFDVSPTVQDERVWGEFAYPTFNTVALVGRAGLESDLTIHPEKAELDSEFWNAGFRWTSTSARSWVEARYGDRYFGNTYLADIQFQGNRARWFLTYTEEPTTLAQRFADVQFSGSPGFEVDDDPLGRPPPTLRGEVWIQKLFNTALRIDGARNQITVGGYDEELDYFNVNEKEETRGANAAWRWQFTPRTDSLLDLGWQRTGFRGSERNDEYYFARLGLNRTVGVNSRVYVLVRRAERVSDAFSAGPSGQNLNDYEEFGAEIGFQWNFGRVIDVQQRQTFGPRGRWEMRR